MLPVVGMERVSGTSEVGHTGHGLRKGKESRPTPQFLVLSNWENGMNLSVVPTLVPLETVVPKSALLAS